MRDPPSGVTLSILRGFVGFTVILLEMHARDPCFLLVFPVAVRPSSLLLVRSPGVLVRARIMESGVQCPSGGPPAAEAGGIAYGVEGGGSPDGGAFVAPAFMHGSAGESIAHQFSSEQNNAQQYQHLRQHAIHNPQQYEYAAPHLHSPGHFVCAPAACQPMLPMQMEQPVAGGATSTPTMGRNYCHLPQRMQGAVFGTPMQCAQPAMHPAHPPSFPAGGAPFYGGLIDMLGRL